MTLDTFNLNSHSSVECTQLEQARTTSINLHSSAVSQLNIAYLYLWLRIQHLNTLQFTLRIKNWYLRNKTALLKWYIIY